MTTGLRSFTRQQLATYDDGDAPSEGGVAVVVGWV
ncbi:hypothetical protein BJ994_002312 [Arthrobacter pigmenti]|uniref:Uncharacterized protein n=1 Tax=Arthrobacter pigmenti TaxID=271432 RepID=A0A846RW30_9MICC|nr:hypothetical protein [Arthrobacter pigmenti]